MLRKYPHFAGKPEEGVIPSFEEILIENKGGPWKQYFVLLLKEKHGIVQGLYGDAEEKAATEFLEFFCKGDWSWAFATFLMALKGNLEFEKALEHFPKGHPQQGQVSKIQIILSAPQETFWTTLFNLVEKHQIKEN